MKKKPFNSKLSLSKETISKLNNNEMLSVKGGYHSFSHPAFPKCEIFNDSRAGCGIETYAGATLCVANTCNICEVDTALGNV